MESLSQTLRRASLLAQCDCFIKYFNSDLTRDELKWALNLFTLNPPTFHKDSGNVALLLFKLDENLSKDILNLSDKIKSNKELNCVDWDLILCGIEKYRSKLLRESFPQQNCGELW